VQAFLLHQFLPLLLLVPATGAMSLVTTSVVGEKQARSLEALLATPLTTTELLAAKIGIAFAVSIALLVLGYGLMTALAAVLTSPGVAATLLTSRPVALVTGLGPALSAITLVLGVTASARASDARGAQQFGVVVVLPVVGLFVAQIGGWMLLRTSDILILSASAWALALVLLWLAVRIFDREHILTKWS
jgi:ABC-2 type transport system permease protein